LAEACPARGRDAGQASSLTGGQSAASASQKDVLRRLLTLRHCVALAFEPAPHCLITYQPLGDTEQLTAVSCPCGRTPLLSRAAGAIHVVVARQFEDEMHEARKIKPR